MQRNSAMDAVKGFAILLVMLGHCIVLNGLHKTDPYLYDAIKSVQMPLFMAVSGAVAGMSYAKRGEVQLGVLKKRAVSYLVPFFSWFLLVFFVTHAINWTLGFSVFGQELLALLFQTDRGLWFLTTLFEITLLVIVAQYITDVICRKVLEKLWLKISILCIFLILGYGLFFVQARSGFLLFSPSLAVQYMPFYVLYYLFFGYKEAIFSFDVMKKISKIGCFFCVLAFIVFFTAVVVLDLNKSPMGIRELLMQMWISLCGSYACFYLIYFLHQKIEASKVGNTEQMVKWNITRLLPWIGQYTLEIYVLHFRFARVLHIADKNIVFYSWQGLGYFLATFVIMSVCTTVCIWLLKKSKITNWLLFGK